MSSEKQDQDAILSRPPSEGQGKHAFDSEKQGGSVGMTELGSQLDSQQAEKVQGVLQDEELITPEEDKRLLRKIDWYLLPLMMSIYGMQFADKISLSAGILFNLAEDTSLADNQFSWLATIFYLGYLVAQPLLNYYMQRVNAARFLSILIVVWGGVVMCLAACQNFASLMALRFLLGAMEGGITPGFMLIVGSWYKTSEQNSRQMMYLAMNTGFSLWTTVVIYFLGKHSEQQGGLSGWRTINLFLGGVTIFVGLIACVFLRLPSTAWWLNDREKKAAHARTINNGTGGGETQAWKLDQVWDAFTDPNTYFLFFLTLISCIPNGGLTTFQSVIFSSFGFSNLDSIIYQLPLYATSCLSIFFCIAVIHYFPGTRFFFMSVTVLPTLAAVLVAGLLPTDATYKWIKYGVYMMSVLFSINGFLTWALMPSIIGGRTKKSVVSTTTFIGYCVGNMIGPQAFRDEEAPQYTTGLIVTAAMLGLTFVLTLAWLVYLVWANARRRKVLRAMGVSEEERVLKNKINGELDMTDNKNIYFLYTH
ncbi:uncharacterized protein PFL1_00195 [Pseudozyma flocculosa PF-1]|uniref:uncharacterized protein n=1 Tax=Pseudozyma flocculosa PF-1 TaxID=1277687 RepID=UPI000456094F|nr:uncharacterized protein PFL1_00195 [Pseudozyma flocculosa PF-1]EPQ31997.1 hypothetical protein PFL1_00195 [Pseudozyma flocculosa PF-1]